MQIIFTHVYRSKTDVNPTEPVFSQFETNKQKKTSEKIELQTNISQTQMQNPF